MSTETLLVIDIGTSGLHVEALYWGVLISTMLSGISISQGWTYAHNNDDNLADFSVSCLSCQVLRHYLMSNYGNTSVFLTLPHFVVVAGTVIGVAYVSELFFASRGLSATAFLGEISYP
ncbi:hypothetical protein L208DRAFT_1396340, partial [Tricholoma matsutake]